MREKREMNGIYSELNKENLRVNEKEKKKKPEWKV